MRRAFILLVTLAVLLVGFRMLSACLSVTPIVVERDASGGPDAGCLACLQLPDRCGGLIEQCQNDPRCVPAYACIVRDSCLDLHTLDDKIKCGLPCAQDAGIQSVTDPVVSTYLVGLVACGQQKCAVPCNLGEGGIGL
jgi:hypothetical protein